MSTSCEIGIRQVPQNIECVVVRQHAINWANIDPDLSRHIASLGQYDLMR